MGVLKNLRNMNLALLSNWWSLCFEGLGKASRKHRSVIMVGEVLVQGLVLAFACLIFLERHPEDGELFQV